MGVQGDSRSEVNLSGVWDRVLLAFAQGYLRLTKPGGGGGVRYLRLRRPGVGVVRRTFRACSESLARQGSGCARFLFAQPPAASTAHKLTAEPSDAVSKPGWALGY